jgi:hypothetical protein
MVRPWTGVKVNLVMPNFLEILIGDTKTAEFYADTKFIEMDSKKYS